MSTLYRLGDEEVILITGAPDVLFPPVQFQQTNTGVAAFDQSYWKGRLKSMPVRGCAWWRAAWKPAREGTARAGSSDLKDGVILLGIAGMMDPPRPEAITAIADCLQADPRKNDHRDHPQTAMSIGQMLGIGNAASAITGRELEAMDDRQLSEAAQQYDIFARTSPEDKFRLVQACRASRKWWE